MTQVGILGQKDAVFGYPVEIYVRWGSKSIAWIVYGQKSRFRLQLPIDSMLVPRQLLEPATGKKKGFKCVFPQDRPPYVSIPRAALGIDAKMEHLYEIE